MNAASNYDLSMTVSTRGAEPKVTKLGASATKTGTEFDRSATKIDKAATATKKNAAAATAATKANDSAARSSTKHATASTKLTASLKKQLTSLLAIGAVYISLTAGVLGLGRTVGVFAQFESSMAAVQAVTSATADQMSVMTDSARFLGETTKFSASEAAAGMEFLGRAGFSTTEIVGAMPSVLSLAAAAQLDLGRASDITSNIMSAFSVRADESSRIADALAASAANANTDVEQMGEAMKFVGPVAASLGISMEDAAAGIGTLSNAGLQASVAGTGLRRILSELASPSDAARDTLAALGVEVDDLNPKTTSLVDIVQTLADANLEAADAFEIFGDRGAPAILALTSQVGGLKRLTATVKESEGAADSMARTMDNNLAGAGRELRSAFESLQITIGTRLAPAIEDGTRALTSGVRAVTDWLDSGKDLDRLLDELAPSADKASQSFRNLANEVERSAAAKELLALVEAYNKVAAEIESVSSRLAIADPGSVIEAKLTAQLHRLQEAFAALPSKIDEARAALAGSNAETEKAPPPVKELTQAQLDAAKAALENAQGLRELLAEMQDLVGFAPRLTKELLEISQIELPSGTLGQLPRIDGLGPGAEFRQPGDVIETAAGQMTILRRETEGASSATAEWLGRLGELTSGFGNVDESIGRIINSLGTVVSSIFQAINVTGDWRAGLAGAASALGASGLFGDTGSSILSGAGAGAGIGFAIGGPAGAGYGAAIGAAVGLISSELEKTAEAFADGATHADGIKSNLAEGELSTQVDNVVGIIKETFNDLLSSLGGTVTNFTQFGVLWREDSKGLRVAIDGVWTSFGDNVQGALDFAVTELVKRSNIVGLAPEVQSAVDSFTGNTIDQLQEAIALALRLEAGRLGPEAAAVRDNLRGIFADIQAGLDAGIDVTGGFADLSRARDELLGVARSQEEIIGSRIDAFNAEIKVQQAQLQVMLAETLARAAQSKVNRGLVDEQISQIQVGGALVGTLGAVSQQMGHMASVSAASLAVMSAATEDAVAAINDALAQLDSLLISDGEREIAIRRGSGGGASFGDGGAAQRQREREEFLEAMERVALAISGVSSGVLDFLDSLNRLDDELEAAAAAGIGPEEIAAARADQLELIEQNLLAPWEELALRVGETDFETSFRELWNRAEESFQNAFNLAVRLAEEQGISLEEAYRPLFDVIAEGFNAETLGLFADELQRLSESGDVQGIQDLQDSLIEMFDSLPQGVQESLMLFWPDLMQQFEESTEIAKETLQQSLSETFADLGHPLEQAQLDVQKWQDAFDQVTHSLEQDAISFEEAQVRFVQLGQLAFAALGEQINSFIDRYYGEVEGNEERRIELERFKFEMELFNLNAQFELLKTMGVLSEEALATFQETFEWLNDPANQPTFEPPEPAPPPAPPAPPAGQSGSGETLMEQAQNLLDQLADLGAPADPLAAVNAQFDELLLAAEGLAGILPSLGTSLSEVTQQIEELREAEIERLFEQAFASFDDLLRSLQSGPDSGLAGIDQVQAAQAEFERLAALAAAGDLDAAAQLGASGSELLALAEGVSPSLTRSIRSLILSTGSELGRVTGGDGGKPAGEPTKIRPSDLIFAPVKLTAEDVLRSAGLPFQGAQTSRGTAIFTSASSASRSDGSDLLRSDSGQSDVFLDPGSGQPVAESSDRPAVIVVKGDEESTAAVLEKLEAIREEVIESNRVAKSSEEARHDDHLDRVDVAVLSIEEIRKNRPRLESSAGQVNRLVQ